MAKLNDYEVLSVMGTGTFGTCFKVQNKLSRKIFVWKAIDYSEMDEEHRQQLISEINLLKQLNHPNIVKYFNHIIKKATQTLYIIMECCEGGDLAMLIKKCRDTDCHFEESFIWRALFQLSKGLQGCHSHKTTLVILHRDIKPANVFLDSDGNVKLGDFGLARVLLGTEHFAETIVGTPYYMSPEIIKGDKYNRKSDIWSLGCLIYELCSLSPPFRGQRIEQLSRNISGGQFDRIPERYSSDLQNIISFMLNVDHGYRPTIEVILHHPTVASNITNFLPEFPKLVSNSINPNWFTLPAPELSSTQISNVSPLDRDTTSDLRRELFQSPRKRQHFSISDSDNHDRRSQVLTKRPVSDDMTNQFRDPNEITQEIFSEALRQRLLAIKNRESILKQIEDDLKTKEQELDSREKYLTRRSRKQNSRISRLDVAARPPKPLKRSVSSRPGIRYDESSTSIEPNDSIVMPTATKMSSEKFLQRPPIGRHVSFKSPLKPQNLSSKKLDNTENVPPQPENSKQIGKFKTIGHQSGITVTKQTLDAAILKNCTLSSCSDSKAKEEIEKCKITATLSKATTLSKSSEIPKSESIPKRKSFFNLFNIGSKKSQSLDKVKDKDKPKPQINVVPKPIESAAAGLPTHWTAEHKRIAFEMLAVMNATSSSSKSGKDDNPSTATANDQSIVDEMIINKKIVRHDRKRQSMFIVRSSSEENILKF